MLSVLFRTLTVALLLLCSLPPISGTRPLREPVASKQKRPAATKTSTLPPGPVVMPPQPPTFQSIPSPTRGLNCLAHTRTGHSSDTLL
ncbi:hypothetical protein V8F33_007744 [Rhypophila sp. PSN 637]